MVIGKENFNFYLLILINVFEYNLMFYVGVFG